MTIRQPEAMLLAWWLRQKIKGFSADAEMTGLLARLVHALENGETIEVRGGSAVLQAEE